MTILLKLTPGRCGPSSTQMTLKSGMLLSGIVVPTREHKINKSTHARLPKKLVNLVTVTLGVLPYGAFTLTDW